MRKKYNSSRTSRFLKRKSLFTVIAVLFVAMGLNAQVTTNSGSGLAPTYADLASAITALNGATITSPVIITLDTGNPQTAPAGGYLVTAQGSAVNTITIQGSSNTITASNALTAGALNDAIFKMQGADYVTLQNFVMQENAANTTTTAASNNMTEWGVAILYATSTNGAQNNTIQNNTISLNRTYQNTFGIYSNSTHAPGTPTTAATATTVNGGNHGLKLYTNAISNVNNGVVVIGPTAVADQNSGIDIGGASLASGNIITNFGTTGTFSGYANVSGSTNGILVRNSNGTNVSYNTITSSVGGVTAGTLNGIQVPASSNAPTGLTFTNTINNNTISLQSGLATGTMNGINYPSGSASATSSVIINNNDFNNFGHTVASSGTITFISLSSTNQFTTINNNTFTNISVNTTGSVTFIVQSFTAPSNGSKTVNNNAIITGFTKSGAGGTVLLISDNGSTVSGAVSNCQNNNFSNISLTGATILTGLNYTDGGTAPTRTVSGNILSNWTGGTSAIVAMNFTYWNGASSLTNNTITNITGQSTVTGINIGSTVSTATAININGNTVNNLTSTGTGAAVVGITCSNTSSGINIFNNGIDTLSSTGASAVSGIVISGANASGTNVFKNKIYNLSGSNASSTVNGILISGGALVTAYNNIIGDLTTPVANAANPLIGINITGGTTVNVYYNTVMLNGSSTGALFGSSAISAATATNLDLRNNIFVNNSSVAGSGLATAYRRSSTTLTSYAANSNNNLFYGSTIFTDGTNTDATLGAYQSRVASRDAFSISLNPTFTSTAGSNSQFLHIDAATPTLIEGGAATIASYADDFDGDARNGSTPDIGADEFTGIPVVPVVINSVGISPTGNQCTAVSRNVTANITAGGSDITSVSLNYSFNGVVQTPIAMTGGTLTAGSTSTFSATIPVASPVDANVTWFVSATDPFSTKSTSGTAYQDEPLFGATATATASVATICNTGNTVLSASLSKNGSKDIGSGSLVTSSSGTSSTNYVSPFTHYYGGYKTQYIIRASELAALGLVAGNSINSMAFDVTTVGASATYNGFTVGIGNTAATALTTTFDTSSVTQVYTGNLNVPATGLLTIPFGTGTGSSNSIVWDGTSNVLINICWSNNNTGGGTAGSAEVKYDPTSFVAMAYYRVDSQTQATVCGTATATATLSNRPKIVFAGNFALVVTNYSWSDGSSVVGTGNNLSVAPTVTTTYTATLTSSGCAVATNSVVVTVNTTAAPTGTSPQSFTSGQTLADIVVTGNTIVWYASASDAASGINALPNSTLLVDNTTYYATQTVSGCPSTSSLAVTVQVPLGRNEFDATAFKVYPNPVSNILNIEYTSDLTNVSVYNMLGQQVLFKKVTAASAKIDMSSLYAGTYLVKVESGKITKTLKVVKN